jgi:hypothetical protein
MTSEPSLGRLKRLIGDPTYKKLPKLSAKNNL